MLIDSYACDSLFVVAVHIDRSSFFLSSGERDEEGQHGETTVGNAMPHVCVYLTPQWLWCGSSLVVGIADIPQATVRFLRLLTLSAVTCSYRTLTCILLLVLTSKDTEQLAPELSEAEAPCFPVRPFRSVVVSSMCAFRSIPFRLFSVVACVISQVCGRGYTFCPVLRPPCPLPSPKLS